MSIELKQSGFHEWHDNFEKSSGRRRGKQQQSTNVLRITIITDSARLFWEPKFGFTQDNLDFLAGATNAKWLWFSDVSLRHVDAIYELTELEIVGINPKRPGIDFSRLRALRTVINYWIKADAGISGIDDYRIPFVA